MLYTTPPADDNAQPSPPHKPSGFFEIDVREGFERVVRNSTENALTCYREAAKARAAGDEREAYALIELAEQSLDVVRDTLCRIEGLD